MSHNSPYKVSVIVPVHNVEKFLPRCIDSLLKQTLPAIEIILVENGSTDNSLEVCRNFSSRHANIQVLTSKKCGPSEARNLGMKHANGEYIGFVDGDDFVDSSMYEKLINALETTHSDTAFCNYKLIHFDGKEHQKFHDTDKTIVMNAPDATLEIICDRDTSSPCVRIFKKSFTDTHLFPEGCFYEDHAIIYKWISDCHKIARVDSSLYFYCLRQGSTTQSVTNFKLQLDYMTAQLNRLDFIADYTFFSKRQRREAVKKVIKDAIKLLKQYIYSSKGNNYEKVLILRDMILQKCNYSAFTVGFETWFRVKRINHFWQRYYSHVLAKANS